MIFSIWTILLCFICIVPFSIAFFYLTLGIKILVSGRREKNRTKTISGYNTIFSSVFLMFTVYFIWVLLYQHLLSVEL
ncbi:MAG TPA: hypothetical protein VMZ03_10735 [Chitinophagaceae bacterium]|nr:hypothetical protein [Chitinophagaceae bacterium]